MTGIFANLGRQTGVLSLRYLGTASNSLRGLHVLDDFSDSDRNDEGSGQARGEAWAVAVVVSVQL